MTNLDVYFEPYLIHREVDLIQCFYFNKNSPLSTPGYLLHFADLPQVIIGGDQLMKEWIQFLKTVVIDRATPNHFSSEESTQ